MPDMFQIFFLIVAVPGMLAAYLFFRFQKFPGSLEVPPQEGRGELLLASSPGGKSEFVPYSKNRLDIELYEKGLLVWPSFGKQTWLKADDIRSISVHKGHFSSGSKIEVEADSFLLWTSPEDHRKLVDWWGGNRDAVSREEN